MMNHGAVVCRPKGFGRINPPARQNAFPYRDRGACAKPPEAVGVGARRRGRFFTLFGDSPCAAALAGLPNGLSLPHVTAKE